MAKGKSETKLLIPALSRQIAGCRRALSGAKAALAEPVTAFSGSNPTGAKMNLAPDELTRAVAEMISATSKMILDDGFGVKN